jgi:hypothetical protein
LDCGAIAMTRSISLPMIAQVNDEHRLNGSSGTPA